MNSVNQMLSVSTDVITVSLHVVFEISYGQKKQQQTNEQLGITLLNEQ
jgi:hypothetical protein